MKYRSRLVLILLASILAVFCDAKTLNEKIETDDHDYEIHFRNRDSTDIEWFTSDEEAQDIADHFDPEIGDGVHDHFLDLGFREPDFVWGRDVKLRTAPLTGGRANALFPNRIILPPEQLREIGHATVDCKGLCAHELHHMVQYEYVPWGTYFLSIYPFGIEGPACAMEDQVSADLDDPNFRNTWGYGGGFTAQAFNYLDVVGEDYLWSGSGYHSALFWKYLMEQFGSDRSEPGLGVDFLERFYFLSDRDREGVTTTLQTILDEKDRQTTSDVDAGVELREVFQDFSVANWMRRYRNPRSYASAFTISLDDAGRYYYEDENPSVATTSIQSIFNDGANWPYISAADENSPFPSKDWKGVNKLTPGSNTGMQSDSVGKWASQYYLAEFDTTSAGAGHGIGFWGQASESEKAWFAVIGVRASGTIDVVAKNDVHPETGNSFSHTIIQPVVDPYQYLVAVVNGEHSTSPSLLTDFEYYFGNFQPTIDILEPTSSYRAYVGDGSEPERFLVKVSVNSPDYLGKASVSGLTAEHFDVAVGVPASDPANDAEVLSAAYVLGEYWLTCQAPVKDPSPSAAQALTVSIGSSSDLEESAVLYANLEVDQMLVIDRSGSMSATVGGVQRVEAARAASQLFIDASGSDDQIGVVRFNGNEIEPDASSYADADVIYGLDVMTSQFERDLINLLIDDSNPAGDKLLPLGTTSIGDGLYWGAKEIIDNGKAESEKWIILLSDGHQNEDSEYLDHKSLLEANGIHVETIALGDGVDKNLLQQISDDTSGRYYEVTEPTGGSSFTAASSKSLMIGPPLSLGSGGGSAPGSSSSILLELADRYLLASERIHRRERIIEEWGSLAASDTEAISLTLAEGGLEDCVITLIADQSSANPTLVVERPDGTIEPAPAEGYTSTSPDGSGNWWDPEYHVSYRVGNMEDGTWSFDLGNAGAASFNYLFVISGRNREGAQSSLYFTQFHGDSSSYASNGLFLIGLPQPITVVLTDGSGPIVGADVLATVTHPDRSPVMLRLRDQGGSHDGAAGDGVYSAVFAATTEGSGSGGTYLEGSEGPITGSYEVTVLSSGLDHVGRAFDRVDRGSFHLYNGQEAGSDTDSDGMPDTYELLHTGLDPFVPDGGGDCDDDGLTNLDEYQRGTHPCNEDTDGGGENDKSEVDHGANPLDHTDDVLRTPLIAQVIEAWGHLLPPADFTTFVPQPGQNLISFSVERGFDFVELHRSASAAGPFTHIANINSSANGGVHIDASLINGTAYYYRIRPITAAGRVGVFGQVFSGTPRAEVEPPEGLLSIANGVPFISSPFANLRILASADAVTMRLARSQRDLETASWVPFTSNVPSYPLGSPSDGSPILVFCELRDSVGHQTILQDSIRFLSPATSGTVIANVIAPLDTSNLNVRLVFTDTTSGEEFTAYTPPTGLINFGLPAGTWDVHVSQRGYQSIDLASQIVPAGGRSGWV